MIYRLLILISVYFATFQDIIWFKYPVVFFTWLIFSLTLVCFIEEEARKEYIKKIAEYQIKFNFLNCFLILLAFLLNKWYYEFMAYLFYCGFLHSSLKEIKNNY
jgi:hypothetical protein